MEIGNFEVVSKIFKVKRIYRNEAFSAECRGTCWMGFNT